MLGNIQKRNYELLTHKKLVLSYDWEKETHTGIRRYHFQLQWMKQIS